MVQLLVECVCVANMCVSGRIRADVGVCEVFLMLAGGVTDTCVGARTRAGVCV